MIFAAKEAVEKKATEIGRREGLQEGRLEGRDAERERIERELELLARSGIDVPPEIVRVIAGKSDPRA